jgi:Kef-type K+ transport system membrane component KefB
MNFGILFLFACAGLIGPLLSGFRRLSVPLVVGEIGAGILIGQTGLGLINPAEPTMAFLSSIGFAMLVFLVGINLPLHDSNLRKSIKHSITAVGLVFAFAIPVGFLLSHITGLSPAIFILIIGSSSSSVVLPIIAERGLSGPTVLLTKTWVALADAATIIALPLAMSTGNTLRVMTGAAVVTLVAAAAYFGLRAFQASNVGAHYRELSKYRGWALDLRISMVMLIGLVCLATYFGTSILVAGFAAGTVVSLLAHPKRFNKQLIGLAQGFFVPFFFVDLGAKLDVRALISTASNIELALLIFVSTIVVHVVVSKLVKLPFASGLMATAQLSLPAAIVSLGMTSHTINSGQGAAIVGASLLSLISCSIGAALMKRVSTAEQPQPAWEE